MQELAGKSSNGTASSNEIGKKWSAYALARADLDRFRTDDEEDQYLSDLEDQLLELRNELANHYLPLVKATAERMRHRLPGSVDIGDLMGEGVFGLMDAIDQFDAGRDTRFETFAPRRISGAMLDYLRSLDWIPRLTRSRHRLTARVSNAFQVTHGRLPTQDELKAELEEMGEEVDTNKVLNNSEIVHMGSLHGKPPGMDDSDDSPVAVNLQDDRCQDPCQRAQRNDLKQYISRELTRCERLILILYHYESMTMKEIGRSLDLSESRVSQIHTLLMQRLRARFEDRESELELQAV